MLLSENGIIFKTMNKILLVSFKTIDRDLINHLKKKIAKIMRCSVVINNEQVDVPNCRKRGLQLFAKDLIPGLRAEVAKTDADVVLGIIDKDLYVKSLNFIFDLAYVDSSIISLYRLTSGDKGLSYRRAVKEAVHELGHLAGLAHCPNVDCVMHFSNSLEDTDVKSETFCSGCKERLQNHLPKET